MEWLIAQLSQDNIFSIWYDQKEIHVGDSLQKQIEQGLTASSCIIVVLSKTSIQSKWVQFELNSALFYSAQKSGITILPVLIEKIQIPSDISSYRYADFTGDKTKALNDLQESIKHAVRKPSHIPNWDLLTPKTFEELVYDLLKKQNFEVFRQTGKLDHSFDFLANLTKISPDNQKIQEKWIVEAKYYKNSKLSFSTISKLCNIAKKIDADTVLLVTNSIITASAKQLIANNLNEANYVIWDEICIIDLLSKYDDIWDKYFSNTPAFKSSPVKIIDPQLDQINKLVGQIKKCPPGKAGWKEYEDICIEILNYLFVPPLKLPKIQSRTESGINIRDAIYPNRCEDPNWMFIRTDYDARYILFEFKNYSNEDGASEIDKSSVNQVRNYLNTTLGRIGFVCGRKQPTLSALTTRNIAFSEEKKLILFLNDQQLIEMMMRKYRGEEPSDVIMDLIDEFNINYG